MPRPDGVARRHGRMTRPDGVDRRYGWMPRTDGTGRRREWTLCGAAWTSVWTGVTVQYGLPLRGFVLFRDFVSLRGCTSLRSCLGLLRAAVSQASCRLALTSDFFFPPPFAVGSIVTGPMSFVPCGSPRCCGLLSLCPHAPSANRGCRTSTATCRTSGRRVMPPLRRC